MTVHKLTDETRKQAIAYCDYCGGADLRDKASREAVDAARRACDTSWIMIANA